MTVNPIFLGHDFFDFLSVLINKVIILSIDKLQVLAEKLPELLDFSKDLESLEASTKVPLLIALSLRLLLLVLLISTSVCRLLSFSKLPSSSFTLPHQQPP